MHLSATAVPAEAILAWRGKFRQEMQCQIVHDSLHSRVGWTQSYLLKIGLVAVGYGTTAVAGPWKGTKTVFEFHVATEHRPQASALFELFVSDAGITAFEVQTNDALLTGLLHRSLPGATCEKVVFQDRQTTALPANGAIFRRVTPDDVARIFPHHREPIGDWLLELDGSIVATGGIGFKNNRPYGELYMEVATPFQRRGLGSYLVQELKRICRENGSIPCARCNPENSASQKTLQKAGFVPCARIMVGALARPSP